MSSDIGELVLKAKGNRSYREYQRDSGVDAAIISKIVKGTYIPRKIDTYKKLASCADNGVTYEELIEAANFSKEYKSGLTAGVETAQMALGVVGLASMAMFPGMGTLLIGLAKASSLMKKSVEETQNVKNAEKGLQRFCSVSDKIILSQLALNGISVQQLESSDVRIFENEFDTYFHVNDRHYMKLIIRHLYVAENVNVDIIKETTKLYVAELMFSKEEKLQNIAIVTKSEEAFSVLKGIAGRLSFKGNLIAMLIDDMNFELKEQIVLSTFDNTIEPKKIII